MTFLQWANSRKWHEWILQGWWIVCIILTRDSVYAVMLGFMVVWTTLSDYREARWRRRAEKIEEIAHDQAFLIKAAMARLTKEERKQHDALIEKFQDIG